MEALGVGRWCNHGGAAALGPVLLWWTWQTARGVRGAWHVEGLADWARGHGRTQAVCVEETKTYAGVMT